VNARTGTLDQTFSGHVNTKYKTNCAFAPPIVTDTFNPATNSNIIASVYCGSEDGRVCGWDAQTGTMNFNEASPSTTTAPASSSVSALAHHPLDPTVLASGCITGHIYMWNKKPI
jgi:WD40 repeat protein